MTALPELFLSLMGTVRAWAGDRELDLGSPQQRTVLAALLVRGEDSTSVGELAEVLWGEAIPPGGAATVRTYIYRIRRMLSFVGCTEEASVVSSNRHYGLVLKSSKGGHQDFGRTRCSGP